MRTKIALLTSLAALGALLPGAALAQELPPGSAGEPPPAPGSAAGLTTPPMDATGAVGEAPAPAAPEEGPKPVPGWMRIDSDAGALQLWGGGTFPFNDSVGLAFDMYVNSGFLGEFDIGPAITAGPFIITPMIGLQIDWNARKAAAIVPQLYVVGGPSPIYAELWLQYYMNKTFAGTSNQLYGRLIVDFKISDYVAIGPELDILHDSEADPALLSLAIGPNVLLSNVGAASSFMGFLGYETKDTYGEADPTTMAVTKDTANHLTGRLTFIHNF